MPKAQSGQHDDKQHIAPQFEEIADTPYRLKRVQKQKQYVAKSHDAVLLFAFGMGRY